MDERVDRPEHFCGGYECDNPATIEILAGHYGGMLGWLCQDCADEYEHEFTRSADRNRFAFGLRKKKEVNG